MTSPNSPQFHQKAYVCIHVFDHERPVLLVSREDGDWSLLCGDYHEDDASAYRVVGIGHVIESDPTLEEILDLEPDFEAERPSLGERWTIRSIASGDALE